MSLLSLKDRTVRIIVNKASKEDEAFKKSVENYQLETKKREMFEKFFPVVPSSTLRTLPGELTKDLIVLELKEVKSIKLSYSADITVEFGISVAFIQPWYIKPVEISITGSSYIGAYPYIANADADIDELYKIFKNNLMEITGNRRLLLLEIVNNPNDTDRFFGYFSKLDFGEDVSKPYILDYDLTFIGASDMKHSNEEGKEGASQDKKRVK